MTKNQEISLMILGKMAQGMTVREALDTVLGEGTVEKLAGELYDALREKANG